MPLSVPSPPMQIKPFDLQAMQPIDDFANRGYVGRIDVIARGADDRPPARRVELGDGSEQRIQAHVRHARVEQAAESLDEADDFDAALAGAQHGAVDRRVECGRVAPRGQNADAFHNAAPSCKTALRGRFEVLDGRERPPSFQRIVLGGAFQMDPSGCWTARQALLQNPVQTQTRKRVTRPTGIRRRTPIAPSGQLVWTSGRRCQ